MSIPLISCRHTIAKRLGRLEQDLEHMTRFALASNSFNSQWNRPDKVGVKIVDGRVELSFTIIRGPSIAAVSEFLAAAVASAKAGGYFNGVIL